MSQQGVHLADLTRWDAACAVILVAALIAYLAGSRLNTQRAKRILAQLRPTLAREFVQFGTDAGVHLVRNSAREFFFYATGRLRVQRLDGRIALAPRHDLWGRMAALIWPVAERVTIELTADPAAVSGSAGASVIAGVFSQRAARAWLDERADVRALGRLKRHPQLPRDSLAVYTDSAAFLSLLASRSSLLARLLVGCGVAPGDNPRAVRHDECLLHPFLEALVVSSVPVAFEPAADAAEPRFRIALTVRLPSPGALKAGNVPAAQLLPQMLDLVLELADVLWAPGAELDEEPAQRAARTRARQQYLEQRGSAAPAKSLGDAGGSDDAFRRRKAEQRRAEEARLAELPPAEQRKVEERERRKQAKRDQRKAMKRGRVVV